MDKFVCKETFFYSIKHEKTRKNGQSEAFFVYNYAIMGEKYKKKLCFLHYVAPFS